MCVVKCCAFTLNVFDSTVIIIKQNNCENRSISAQSKKLWFCFFSVSVLAKLLQFGCWANWDMMCQDMPQNRFLVSVWAKPYSSLKPKSTSPLIVKLQARTRSFFSIQVCYSHSLRRRLLIQLALTQLRDICSSIGVWQGFRYMCQGNRLHIWIFAATIPPCWARFREGVKVSEKQQDQSVQHCRASNEHRSTRDEKKKF